MSWLAVSDLEKAGTNYLVDMFRGTYFDLYGFPPHPEAGRKLQAIVAELSQRPRSETAQMLPRLQQGMFQAAQREAYTVAALHRDMIHYYKQHVLSERLTFYG